jgi:hypothetical protein
MSLFSWPWHRTRTPAAARNRSGRAPRPQAARPGVEALETRTVPSAVAAHPLVVPVHPAAALAGSAGAAAGPHGSTAATSHAALLRIGRVIHFKDPISAMPDGPAVRDPNNPAVFTQNYAVTASLGDLGQVIGTVTITTTFDKAGNFTFTDTFVLKNGGDEIRGTGKGTGKLNKRNGVYHIVEEDVFTGGTGRFAGVTGEAKAHTELNIGTGLEHGTISGVLRFPN